MRCGHKYCPLMFRGECTHPSPIENCMNRIFIPGSERKANTTAQSAGCSVQHLRRNNAIVARIMDAGGTAEDCAVALSVENDRLADRVMALDSIAPRKIKLPDGRVLIWRCPDELVPESPMLNDKVQARTAPEEK